MEFRENQVLRNKICFKHDQDPPFRTTGFELDNICLSFKPHLITKKSFIKKNANKLCIEDFR